MKFELPKCPQSTDIWDILASTDKPVVLYGMGNGADKMIDALAKIGVSPAAVFANDGFVRDKLFHGMKLSRYSDICGKFDDFVVLLCFGSSLPDVMERICEIAGERTLYAPELPVCGEGLFTKDFYNESFEKIKHVYDMLGDDYSKELYCRLLKYKLSGDISHLKDCEERDYIDYSRVSRYVDCGAYNGDTIKETAAKSVSLKRVLAFEPDKHSFGRLAEYAKSVNFPKIDVYNAGVYDNNITLPFSDSGNRNSSVGGDKSADFMRLDDIKDAKIADYIKIDAEGSDKEAITGASSIIAENKPQIKVSVYHRRGDIFEIPLLLKSIRPDYRLFLSKKRYLPAWDVNLFAL